jgi:hypothetical protein
VAQAAGSEYERPLVRDFASRQPEGSQTFGSALRNWRNLRVHYRRIAELFTGGERPDAVSVEPRRGKITLFDSTDRPRGEHMDKSIDYMERLLNDPAMQEEFPGWEVEVQEGYWEAGFRRLRPSRTGRIGGRGSGGSR